MNGSITINNIDVSSNEFTNDATATVCFTWEYPTMPQSVYFMLKQANTGDKWYQINIDGTLSMNGNDCVSIEELIANNTTYDVYVEAVLITGDKVTSSTSTFTTPTINRPNNNTCDTLTYLTEMLCQPIRALYRGAEEIYANDCTKERCDPNSLTPTTLTLWSRALRYFHGVKCIACDISALNLKDGTSNQYYVGGGTGWTDMLTQVLPPTNGDSWKLVQSGAIDSYIKEKLQEVWHFNGNVDYIVDNLDNVPENATTVLNLADNKVYEKTGSSWVLSTKITQPNNFGAYNIKYGSNTTGLDEIKAGDVYYYFEGTWNLLNLDDSWIQSTLDEINAIKNKVVVTPNEGNMSIYTTPETTFNCEDYPNGERSVIFITEVPIDDTFHYIYFRESGSTSTLIGRQKVQTGKLGQKPANPQKDGYLFNEWITSDGQPFDFDTPITSDTYLYASWLSSPSAVKDNTALGYNSATINMLPNRSEYIFTFTLPSPARARLAAGLTPLGDELGVVDKTDTTFTLILSNQPRPYNSTYYLRFEELDNNGQPKPLGSTYGTYPLLSPILGLLKSPCSSNTTTNIIDIIEKKSDGTCTPRYQGGKRVYGKKPCGQDPFLLQENGAYLLQENNGKIIIEE